MIHKATRTGREIIAEALSRQPSLRLALGCQETVIGQWVESLRRWYPIASETITGEWVAMPYAIFVNGVEPDYQWAETLREKQKEKENQP